MVKFSTLAEADSFPPFVVACVDAEEVDEVPFVEYNFLSRWKVKEYII